jgi:hypothetical protein
MAQHDYDIANQTAPNFRTDLNDALEAIATNNAGTSAPSVTYANQWWYDTTNDILKIRSEADDAWINVGYLDQSTNEFKPYVGGTQVDTQSTATWETGTSTTEGIVSPAKVKAAITELAESPVKAWVNFDGTGTVSIRESFNVTSITDNGTGDYTVNFDTALVDANYAVALGGERELGSSSSAFGFQKAKNRATGSIEVLTANSGGSPTDWLFVDLTVMR